MLVGHWFFAVHVGDIFGDAFHWTRSEKRNHGNDMMDGLGLHLHQVAGHAAAFQLEETDRMPFADELVYFGVINRDVAEGELDAVTLADVLAGFGHDRERHQPQEVHFEQAKIVDEVHFVLRDRLDRQFITAAGRSMQREVFGEGLVTDDHAGGMRAHVAQAAFHPTSGIKQVLHLIGRFINCPQFGGRFKRFRDGHVLALNRTRDQFGDLVHVCQGNGHHPPDIAHRAASGHGAEGDDLRHTIGTVFLIAILHHFRAAVVLEIQVDIRHRDAIRVEEAFKQQGVAERLHGGDIQRESHQRAVARTAHVVPDVFLTREAAQIPHDQEVFRKTHLIDHAELIVEAFLKLVAVSLVRGVAP